MNTRKHTIAYQIRKTNSILSFCLQEFQKCRIHVSVLLARKAWEVPTWLSESVYRRTDNTMAKRKSAKEQTTIY